ncbi:MAG: hypothetical protein AUI14_03270 [Actinobacteria bacterium 13_2_20CM_2_71_6]|nr:MAG: hypothetical protein AUI14_03270 [Actinobacteria bacterium 13_2_20CM_2_71_6]
MSCRRTRSSRVSKDNLDHHFVVDPAKFDFYAMDCYRAVGEDNLAGVYAREVIRSSTDFDGTERKPMRIAEAQITLGVVAARNGDLEQAVEHGRLALAGDRKSVPSLIMVSRDLRDVLQREFPDALDTRDYLNELQALAT